MALQYAIVAITAIFIMGMIWFRTRLQYSRRGTGLRLERSGRIYFASALVTIITGWVVAPSVGQALVPSPAVTPTLARIVWSLAVYYVFIVVHRVLKSQRVVLFTTV
jgi:hypothetical protein